MIQNKYKVLLVEDETNIRNLVAMMLETSGYQAILALLRSPLRRGAHCASGSWRNGMNTKTTENDVISPIIEIFFTTTNSWWLSDAQWRLLKKYSFFDSRNLIASVLLLFLGNRVAGGVVFRRLMK